MDTRSSKIALVTYLFVALLGFGGLFAYIGHIQQNFSDRMDRVSSSIDSDGPRRRPPVLLERRELPTDTATASSEMEMISELRELLDQRTQLLQQRNEELAETTDDYRKLGEENDRYVAMLSEMTNQNETPNATVAQTEVEGQTRDEDLDLLEWALTESQETIGMLEAAQLQQRELANAIETAIVAAGPSAIPVLLSVLTSDRADLRIWAATLMGRLGPLAFEASDPLRIVSMEDQDPDVRRTATWAVGQIDNSFE